MRFLSETIKSKSNKNVIFAASLADKKWRNSESVFMAEGKKLFKEAVASGLNIKCVYVLEDEMGQLSTVIDDETRKNPIYDDVPVYVLSKDCFSKISTEKAPQGIITVIKYLDNYRNYNIINYKDCNFGDDRIILLYAMQDPGNLGSVIRSAVAFGADRIIMSSDCADVFNPKTVRSAMGSLFRVKLNVFDDFSEAIRMIKKTGRRVFAAELTDSAVSLCDVGLLSSDAVIIGNEGHGIPKDVSGICNGSIYIPISKNTESLNASVAAAIFMWEQNNEY